MTVARRALVFQTKLLPPRKPGCYVPLPRLITTLDHSSDYQLTLVSAAAGYGKSTLIAEWYRQINHEQTGWVSLDEEDNNGYRLLLHLVAALESVAPSLLARLQAESTGDVSHFLSQWVNALLAYDGNLTLVVDDVHVLSRAPAQQVLRELIQYQPPNLRLILVSRHRPIWLPVGRLQLEGELLELDESQLRLTQDESTQLAESLNAPAETLTWEKHQGWVMGLRIAALAGNDSPVQLSHDYFLQEIFHRLAQKLQKFLLRIAIIERLHDAQCRFVTGDKDSSRLLTQLNEQGLFISALQTEQNQQGWYLIHPMFLEFLREVSKDTLAEPLLEQLHQRAARWYLEHEMAVAALRHLKAIKDDNVLAELLEVAALPLLKAGQFALLTPWLEQLDLERYASPQLLMATASASTIMGQEYDAETTLDHLETLAHSSRLDIRRQQMVQVQLRQLRSNVYLRRHQPQTVLDLQPGRLLQTLSLPAQNKANIEGNNGIARWMLMAPESAQQHLTKSVQYGWKCEVPGRVAQSCAGLLQALLAGGQMEEALLRAEQWADMLKAQKWEQLPAMSQYYFVESLLHRYRAERGLEIRSLKRCESCGGNSIIPPFVCLAALAKGRIAYLTGDAEQAKSSWRRARTLALDITLPPSVLPASLLLAESALQIGDEQGIADQLQCFEKRSEQYSPLNRYTLRYLQARLLASQNRPAEALNLLLEEHELPDIDDVLLYARHGLLASAMAALIADESQAEGYLLSVLPLIGNAGWLGLFNEVNSCVVELLSKTAKKHDLASAVWRALQKKRDGMHIKGGSYSSYEALNKREQQILGLLASGHSNKEISEEIHLSLNTVKTHLKNLYLKLDVSSRIQAVKRGEQLKLI